MTTILIPATNASPAITLEVLQAITDFAGLSHMRDVIDDCSTQVGKEACSTAYAELDRIEKALDAQ